MRPPSRRVRQSGDPSMHDLQAKIDCFAALANAALDVCEALLIFPVAIIRFLRVVPLSGRVRARELRAQQ